MQGGGGKLNPGGNLTKNARLGAFWAVMGINYLLVNRRKARLYLALE